MAEFDFPEHAAFFDVLARRRMIRAYVEVPVADEALQPVIDAAFRGPSAGYTQSVEVLVLTGDGVQRYWNVTLPAERRERFPWPGLLRAPVLLVPYVDPERYVLRYDEDDKAHTGLGTGLDAWSVPYWWVDGGAAVENVLLAAEAAGLGACLFGQFEHAPGVRERFGVPDRFRAVGTIALGHVDPDEHRPSSSARRDRRPAGETVHRNRW